MPPFKVEIEIYIEGDSCNPTLCEYCRENHNSEYNTVDAECMLFGEYLYRVASERVANGYWYWWGRCDQCKEAEGL